MNVNLNLYSGLSFLYDELIEYCALAASPTCELLFVYLWLDAAII